MLLKIGRDKTNEIHQEVQQANGLALHPGLLLHHGLRKWPSANDGDTQAKADLLQRIAKTPVTDYYRAALRRWKALTSDPKRFATFQCKLETRLYIGVTRDSAVEAGVTTSHTYGMPIIPGSSLKGAARAAAQRLVDAQRLDEDSVRWIFGEGGDDGEVGGVIFHDAWWDGDTSPFVAEIVTPHQVSYYTTRGEAPPSDAESPIPAPQIAVAGGFYISIEGDPAWAQVAKVILLSTLQTEGIGAKKTSGYGLMRVEG
jgi:CRISPR-associated protein Cmr6